MRHIPTTVLVALLAASGAGCGGTTQPSVVIAKAPAAPQTSQYAPEVYSNSELYTDGSYWGTDLLGIDSALQYACGVPEPTAYFRTDSTQLQDENGDMEHLAECLQSPSLQGRQLQIIGHTDPRGSKEYNRELGLDRAVAIADQLEQRGVPSEQIDTYSMGEELASEDPEQWPEDRKVVIRLAD